MTIADSASEVSIRSARPEDVLEILRLFHENRADVSLFQQDERQIRRNLSDFTLAEKREASLAGCVSLHWHSPEIAEILGLAVDPECQGRGVGSILTRQCVEESLSRNVRTLWLTTRKPGFFARLGFLEISKWEIPLSVLLCKVPLVFQQQPDRWLPSIFGRHMFMKLDSSRTQGGAVHPL
jgi:N-acetylglutamate synthase-like GNAT family acetyltransferase